MFFRLGRYTATHFRTVLLGWLVVAIALGVFAPQAETALSGAGWEASGSPSVQARNLIDRDFHGLSSTALMVVIHSPREVVGDPAYQSVLQRSSAPCGQARRFRLSSAPAPGCRSPATGTPRSSRPERPGIPTRW